MTDFKRLVLSKKAVLFDMDGTLVNTEPLHAQAATMVMKELGLKIDLESMVKDFYGMTDTAVLKVCCPSLNDSEIEAAINKKNIYLIELLKKMNQIEKLKYTTPGLFAFLELLKKQNIKMAVVSASEDIIVEKTLEYFNITPFIELKMGRQQSAKTKPHPDPYIEAMKRLNVEKNAVIIFEDSPTGLKSAVESGAEVIRINGFAHSKDSLHSQEVSDFLFALS